MIASWMVYAIAMGALVGIAATALDRVVRAGRLPTRWIWVVAMIATCAGPPVRFSIHQSARPAARAVASGAAAVIRAEVARAGQTRWSRFTTQLNAMAARLDAPLGVVWISLTALLLVRLAFGIAVLGRGRRRWQVREIDGATVFVTSDLGPAVVAMPRPRILLPEWLLSFDAQQVSTVVRHEREHASAGDPALLLAGSVMTALLPWNVALFWQVRRLRLAVEMDCDARVLRADPRVDRYASLLLAVAQHPRTSLFAAATLTESTSNLERRIEAMTAKHPRSPRIMRAAFGAVSVAAIFAACVAPAPDVVAAPAAPPTDKRITNGSSDQTMPPSERRVRQLVQLPFVFADTTAAKRTVEIPPRPHPATGSPSVATSAGSGVTFAGDSSPKYPALLRRANIEGSVIVRFVIRDDGSVDPESIEIVKSTHDLFTNSVRTWLDGARFTSHQAGRSSPVTMPFVFSLSPK
jgi:TonB family protein